MPAGRPSAHRQYMAPEQTQWTAGDGEERHFALGLVLFEIFTGKRAHDAETLQELRERARDRHRSQRRSSIVSDLDPAIERIILRCLDQDADRRPADRAGVAAALPGADPLAAGVGRRRNAVAGTAWRPLAKPKRCRRPRSRGRGLDSDRVARGCRHLLPRAQPSRDSSRSTSRRRCWPIARSRSSRRLAIRSARGFCSRLCRATTITSAGWGRPNQSPRRWDRSPPAVLRLDLLVPDQPARLDSACARASCHAERSAAERYGHAYRDARHCAASSCSSIRSPAVRCRPRPQERNAALAFDLQAAGLDIANFSAATPQWSPRDFADARAAFEGPLPARADIAVRVEAASYREQPVAFAFVGPMVPSDPHAAPSTIDDRPGGAAVFTLLALRPRLGAGRARAS